MRDTGIGPHRFSFHFHLHNSKGSALKLYPLIRTFTVVKKNAWERIHEKISYNNLMGKTVIIRDGPTKSKAAKTVQVKFDLMFGAE